MRGRRDHAKKVFMPPLVLGELRVERRREKRALAHGHGDGDGLTVGAVRLHGHCDDMADALCGPVSGKCELKTLDAVAASRVACAGPMLSAGGRALLD